MRKKYEKLIINQINKVARMNKQYKKFNGRGVGKKIKKILKSSNKRYLPFN